MWTKKKINLQAFHILLQSCCPYISLLDLNTFPPHCKEGNCNQNFPPVKMWESRKSNTLWRYCAYDRLEQKEISGLFYMTKYCYKRYSQWLYNFFIHFPFYGYHFVVGFTHNMHLWSIKLSRQIPSPRKADQIKLCPRVGNDSLI